LNFLLSFLKKAEKSAAQNSFALPAGKHSFWQSLLSLACLTFCKQGRFCCLLLAAFIQQPVCRQHHDQLVFSVFRTTLLSVHLVTL
jgi:hypothetical protein